MFLSVDASTEAKALHVCSVGSVSTRHAVVCVFLAFIKITISPLSNTSCVCIADGSVLLTFVVCVVGLSVVSPGGRKARTPDADRVFLK